jgi:ferrous iron transport protein B
MNTNQECANCPVHNLANLKKLGVSMENFDYVIALAGNPNTGKSTVFNYLTGLRQHTGNWPGKTVTRAEGGFEYNNSKYKIIDLPGTYSLLSTSTDEEIARDFILFGQPDVTVIVVDASRLERNLNLVLQVLEITDRAVLCLNLMDEARRHEIEIDVRSLERELGIPVVPAAARQGEGMNDLLAKIKEVASGEYVCRPHRLSNESKAIKKSIEELTKKVEEIYPELPNSRWVAMRLLEGDQRIINAIRNNELEQLNKIELAGIKDAETSEVT